ncbi:predicted protein [Botrytis cinerea T4]|uniref:Uncharacterized protein n=1 Tax=Botryotinia fuckeliana (strain T4) TaxID=999810 RepID=G2Y799_BOTF4|nr:predicted protein [Botrytis cinerea T4]
MFEYNTVITTRLLTNDQSKSVRGVNGRKSQFYNEFDPERVQRTQRVHEVLYGCQNCNDSYYDKDITTDRAQPTPSLIFMS